MERESFEDQEVAQLLNANYISIKVDKEERPDVDTIYMNVCQMVNGHGGWPLTVIMTPEQKPFFVGTYLPKQTRGQMFGLMDLLEKVANIWKNDRERLISSSDELVSLLNDREEMQANDEPMLEKNVFGTAYLQFQSQFDNKYGGFGDAPKFPSPHNLMFLLRYAKMYHSKSALDMVEKTLQSMYQGGIYDHIGGGFARYSTDEKWLVPHFEKMLYDNAMLVWTYCEAYQMTKNPIYEMVVQETLQYIMAEMTDSEGGFYCAQDADSEGTEGKYYVFSEQEVIDVLGKEDGEYFNQYYQITKKGNFEGANIPNRIGKELEPVGIRIKQLKEKLYEYRKNRTTLHKDDKILTSWNSLMIVAFAKAFETFREERYLLTAKGAYDFINQKLRREDGRLAIRYRDHHQYGIGNLEDYAFFVMAQITLYEVTFEPSYLAAAVKDADEMIQQFWDQDHAGFYFYGKDSEELILRPKEIYDGAIPSGNSVAAYVLAKLEQLTRKEDYWEISNQQFKFLSKEVKNYPTAYAFALCAFMLKLLDTREIVCIIKDALDLTDLHQILSQYFLPTTVVVVLEEHSKETMKMVAPFTAEYKEVVEESEFYICENFSCHPPIYGIKVLKEYFDQNEKFE